MHKDLAGATGRVGPATLQGGRLGARCAAAHAAVACEPGALVAGSHPSFALPKHACTPGNPSLAAPPPPTPPRPAQAYLRLRRDEAVEEMGDLVLSLSTELMTSFDFHPTFSSAFEVSNKVGGRSQPCRRLALPRGKPAAGAAGFVQGRCLLTTRPHPGTQFLAVAAAGQVRCACQPALALCHPHSVPFCTTATPGGGAAHAALRVRRVLHHRRRPQRDIPVRGAARGGGQPCRGAVARPRR